jgi:transcriptional regulator with XRE-family HTH domain
MLTPSQIRAARALLGLNQARLANAAGLSKTAIVAIETGQSDPRASTLKAIQTALETRGAFFSADGGLYERMQWRGDPPPPEIRKRILSGLNEARRATHRPPLIDDLEG